MVKTRISESINPTLISFKPRQVLLAKRKPEPEPEPKPKPKPMPSVKKNDGDKASSLPLKTDQKALLLRSIAGYLNSNGFSKTLKKFLSEAQIEKDGFDYSSLDLEDIYRKYLESCDDGSTNFCRQQVQDTVSKKKKKRSNADATTIQLEESGKFIDSKKTEQVEVEQVSAGAVKKSVDNVACEPQLQESERKHKEKKKKKSKLDSESLVDNAEPLVIEAKQRKKAKEVDSLRDVVNTNNISVGEDSVKPKNKKTKDGSKSKSSYDGDSKELGEVKSSRTESEKDDNKTFEENVSAKESKGTKKRKRLDTEENNSQPFDKKEVEESKRRKTGASEEPKESYQVAKVNASLESNIDGGEQNNNQVGLNNSVKESDGQVNANLEHKDKSSQHKSVKKAMNGSAEPMTVKAFQRVRIDEVVFTDERLKDNSYWAKDGADSGYGAKAQEVLGQVKGRDFRHEKTKKKRGSYRGGQIDLQSHSIKFNYSDED